MQKSATGHWKEGSLGQRSGSGLVFWTLASFVFPVFVKKRVHISKMSNNATHLLFSHT